MMTTAQVAARLRCSPRTVRAICKRLGWQRTSRDWLLTMRQYVAVGANLRRDLLASTRGGK